MPKFWPLAIQRTLTNSNTLTKPKSFLDQVITAGADVDSTLVYTLVGRLDRETPDLEVLVALASRGWGTFS